MLRRTPSPTADISVDIDPRPLYPGDALEAEVLVTPRVAFVAAMGLLSLSQTELLKADSARDAVPQMMAPRRRGAQRPGGPTYLEHVFARDVSLEPGVPQRYSARLTLPVQAAPTVKGKHARITWELAASVSTRGDWMPRGEGWLSNLARGRGAQYSQELVVFAYPRGTTLDGELLPAEPEATRSYRNVNLNMTLETGQVANGGAVAGNLSVTPQASFQARELRVELTRWERSGSKQARIVESQQVLQRPAVLVAGERTDWAFHLPVPDRLMPSVLARHTFVGWQVKGVIVRALRPDLAVSQPVMVYTSPRA